MSDTIKVLIVDDHKILQDGLTSLLETQDDIEVVGVADNGQEGVEKAGKLLPDVVLMDITMPVLNGLEATYEITTTLPDIKVLVLTMHETDEYVYQIFAQGASGCVTKKAAYQNLIGAIRRVHQGELYISPTISQSVIREFLKNKSRKRKRADKSELTEREMEVLRLVVSGKTTKEIAYALNISYKTVDTHRVHIFRKCNVHNMVDLTKYAIRKKLIVDE